MIMLGQANAPRRLVLFRGADWSPFPSGRAAGTLLATRRRNAQKRKDPSCFCR